MADWIVSFKYKQNPYTVDECVHRKFIGDTCKKHVESTLRHTVRFGEYVEILEIVSAKVWDKQILKERQIKEGENK